jgi:Tfp pilus assembly protein PilO
MFIGAGALIFVYVSPAYTETQQINEESAKYQQALEKATEVQNLKRGLLAKLNEFSGANVERLEKLLPDHINNIRLVLDLDSMATARGLSLSQVNVQREGGAEDPKKSSSVSLAGAVQQQRKFQSVILQFSLVATYTDMITFMRDIERSLRLVDLVSLNISPAQTQQQQLEYSRVPSELARFSGAPKTVQPQLVTSDTTHTFDVSIRTYWLP